MQSGTLRTRRFLQRNQVFSEHRMKKISQREVLEKKHKNFTPTQRYNWFLKENQKFADGLESLIKWFKANRANRAYLTEDSAKKINWSIKYQKGLLTNQGHFLEYWKKLLPKFEKESKKRKES